MEQNTLFFFLSRLEVQGAPNSFGTSMVLAPVSVVEEETPSSRTAFMVNLKVTAYVHAFGP